MATLTSTGQTRPRKRSTFVLRPKLTFSCTFCRMDEWAARGMHRQCAASGKIKERRGHAGWACGRCVTACDLAVLHTAPTWSFPGPCTATQFMVEEQAEMDWSTTPLIIRLLLMGEILGVPRGSNPTRHLQS